jgi:hypothetical protein
MLLVPHFDVTKHLKAVSRLSLRKIQVKPQRDLSNSPGTDPPQPDWVLARLEEDRRNLYVGHIDPIHLVVVNRRADEPARPVRAVVESMQCVDWRHQSVPGTAAYPFF